MKKLKYPFTFEQWKSHPSNRKVLKQIKKYCDKWRDENKYGTQTELQL
jgi:hypothetical protein